MASSSNEPLWDEEVIYRRIRRTTVLLPAVSVLVLLALAELFLQPLMPSLAVLALSSGIAVVGVSIFSRRVFAALEPVRARVLKQNEELRVTGVRFKAIYEAGLSISSDLALDAVLQEVVDGSRRVAGARYGALSVLGEDGEIGQFIASGLSPEQRSQLAGIPTGMGLIGHVMRTGEPYRTEDLSSDRYATGLPQGHPEVTSFLGVPLTYKGRVIGNLYLSDKIEGEFTDQDEEAIQAFAIQAAIAIENARLYQQVQEVAVLHERERIGMDLHDGTIQSIYGVGLTLDDCITRVESEPAEVREDLDKAIERLNGIIRDIRNYIFDLRPLRLQGVDLVAALRELVLETKVNTLMTVDLVVPDERIGDKLAEEQASQLFAIAHEALANVRKHSQAKNVVVKLEAADGRILLSVKDDGRGLAPDRERATGLGLGNMAERAESLGGSFRLESAAGRGAEVRVEIPAGRGEDQLSRATQDDAARPSTSGPVSTP